MSSSKLTLIGAYQYMVSSGDDLFAELDLPEGLDVGVVTNTILMNNAEFEILYSDPHFMKSMIGVWSRKWKSSFQRWYKALILSEYNPVENYDRYEEWTDSSQTQASDSSQGSSEDKTSAYDSSSYQPESKSESAGSSRSDANTESGHVGHIHGNIGVTTSAQMITGDVEVYKNYNIYDMIADCFKTEMLILVY